MAKLVLDARERKLIQLFGDGNPDVEKATLPVGDIMCTYADGTRWIAELGNQHILG